MGNQIIMEGLKHMFAREVRQWEKRVRNQLSHPSNYRDRSDFLGRPS